MYCQDVSDISKKGSYWRHFRKNLMKILDQKLTDSEQYWSQNSPYLSKLRPSGYILKKYLIIRKTGVRNIFCFTRYYNLIDKSYIKSWPSPPSLLLPWFMTPADSSNFADAFPAFLVFFFNFAPFGSLTCSNIWFKLSEFSCSLSSK